MEKELLQKIEELEKNQRKMKSVYGFTLSMLCLAFVAFSFIKQEKFGVIRAKGIIIEDAKGKDRMLIGAPIPHSKDRVRTDTAKVRKHWASQFDNPDQYMGWYKNSANGIVFMNEDDFDEVLVGEDLADANVGVRMYKVSGMLVNNKQGWERVGAGVNTLENGKTRQGFGVDDDSGEAMHMG